MPERREIPSRPRFDYVTQSAHRLLLELGYTKFPISATQVLEDLSDKIVCLSVSEAKKILNCEDPFNLKATHAEARTLKQRDSGQYIIVYDDTDFAISPERLNWTLMHEIGHIILGHLDDFKATALDRGGLSKDEYGILEVETNYFVSEFLMPTPVVRVLNGISVSEISLLFGVSDEAATKKYSRAFEKQYYPKEIDSLILRNFYRFLSRDLMDAFYEQSNRKFVLFIGATNPYRKCPGCFSYITDVDAKFCCYCGNTMTPAYSGSLLNISTQKQAFFSKKGVTHPHLRLKQIENKNSNRLLFCPNCLNSDLDNDAQFCNICGTVLTNVCVSEHKEIYSDSAYCPSCGSVSTFHDVYIKTEKRLYELEHMEYNEDLLMAYDYWDYIRMRLCLDDKHNNLSSVLFYTRAFLDDDDNIIIVADNAAAATEIKAHKEDILAYAQHWGEYTINGIKIYSQGEMNDL